MSDGHDKLITSLVQKMLEKVPAGKRLTSAVVIQLLSTKFAAHFTGVDLQTKAALIESLVNPAPVVAPPPPPVSGASGSDDDSEDSDEDDSDDDDDDEEGSDEEVDGGDDDDEEDDDDDDDDFESDDSDSDDNSSKKTGESAGGEPPAKKSRTEDQQAGEEETAAIEASPQVIKDMCKCLSKLHIRYRQLTQGEELSDYLEYLRPIFVAHKLDPSKYSSEDIKRYKLRRELEELRQDGGNPDLDRNQRHGKVAFSSNTAAVTQAKFAFLDDD